MVKSAEEVTEGADGSFRPTEIRLGANCSSLLVFSGVLSQVCLSECLPLPTPTPCYRRGVIAREDRPSRGFQRVPESRRVGAPRRGFVSQESGQSSNTVLCHLHAHQTPPNKIIYL